MSRVLIVEDNNSDLRQSVSVLKKLQYEDIDSINNVPGAIMHLQDVLDGNTAAPDLVLLDLSFTRESGFEVLRFWKTNRNSLPNTRIVVWTIMGETEQQLCRYFGVDVVPKWTGAQELENVLRTYAAGQGQSAHPGN